MRMTVNPVQAMMKANEARKMKLRLTALMVSTRTMGPVAYTSLAVSLAVCLWHVHVAFSTSTPRQRQLRVRQATIVTDDDGTGLARLLDLSFRQHYLPSHLIRCKSGYKHPCYCEVLQ